MVYFMDMRGWAGTYDASILTQVMVLILVAFPGAQGCFDYKFRFLSGPMDDSSRKSCSESPFCVGLNSESATRMLDDVDVCRGLERDVHDALVLTRLKLPNPTPPPHPVPPPLQPHSPTAEQLVCRQ